MGGVRVLHKLVNWLISVIFYLLIERASFTYWELGTENPRWWRFR